MTAETKVAALDFVVDCSEKPDSFRSIKTTMSVTTSVKQYIGSFSSSAVQSRISVAASASFSSSFVTSCRFWLAANSIWATLVVAACVTVAMRLRMVDGWPFIVFFIFLATGLVIRELWESKLRVKTLLILLLGLASTGFPLWPCLIKGSFISVAGDTFYYTAFGQYLADHHRGLEFGLSPIDQFGATLSETRFGTASVLSFLSVLFHSTTAEAVRIFTLIVLANIFSGFVLLSRRFGCNRLFSLAAGLLAVIGGWTPDAVHLGALDNLLFLSLFPFIVVRLELYRFGSKSWSTSLGLAILATAVYYVYSAGLAIAGVIFLPFFCHSLWFGMYRRGRAWRRYVISACLVLVLIYPYAQVFFTSLFSHLGQGMAKALTGRVFPGLISPRFLPAMFGFGQEYPGIMCSRHDLVLPIIMLAFIVLGSAIWIRRRKTLIMASLMVIILALWQGALLQYDYGLYKVLFIGSLIWIPALFRGGTAVTSFAPRPTRPFAVTLGTIIFFSGAFAQTMEQQKKIPYRQVIPMRFYSDLANLRHKVGDRPVLLVCDNGFAHEYDEFDQPWAVFFLRHINLKVPKYIGLLGDYDPIMKRAKFVGEPADFVLVNKRIEGALWNNQRFSLLELPIQARLVDVQAPNGLEHVNGKPFVWLGNNATRFLIVSKIVQTATFSAWECLTGPSRPGDRDRRIRISIGGNVWQADAAGALSLQVPLKPGLNFLDIACDDSSTVSAQANSDTKAAPLGLWDYRIGN